MANVHKQDGYTTIANKIMEQLAARLITAEQRAVLDVIFRDVFGWSDGRKVAYIPLKRFKELTRIGKPNICRALKELERNKLIIVKKDEKGKKLFGPQKDYDKWTVEIRGTNKTLSAEITPIISTDNGKNDEHVISTANKTLSAEITPIISTDNAFLVVKANIKTIENNSKSRTSRADFLKNFKISENELFKPLFEEFATFRKELKKPFKTQKGVDGWLDRLHKLSANNYETAKAIIQQSISNEWQGIFTLRQQEAQSTNAKPAFSELEKELNQKRFQLGLSYKNDLRQDIKGFLYEGTEEYKQALEKFAQAEKEIKAKYGVDTG
ncbi:MAG: replication protein [Endomicrobium sp.]|jgi:phage replication O-like protein O|nr:replication protein [Endomicrobium sp.]